MADVLQHAFNGLVNGSFYALLALGLAVIFGMLGVVNFAHGAFYMLGAFGAFVLLEEAGINFWIALLLMPLLLGVFGMALERLLVRRLVGLDPLYNFLLTFGLTLIFTDLLRMKYGVQPQQYPQPAGLDGTVDLGLFEYPAYQVFVLVFSVLVSFGAWLLLARTRVGMIVRAATERPELTRALGIDVGRWISPVFGFGIALAGAGRGARGTDAGGQPADGRGPDHPGVRGGGDRRSRLDLRLGGCRVPDRDAAGARERVRARRGDHVGVHPDGGRAAVAAGRAVRP